MQYVGGRVGPCQWSRDTITLVALHQVRDRDALPEWSRYTTSAFMRLKLGDALSRRDVAPHIFETSADAHRHVE